MARFFLFGVILLVSGCSTDIKERQALPNSTLHIKGVVVERSLSSNALDAHIAALDRAFRERIKAFINGRIAVDVRLMITGVKIVSKTARALGGVLVGSNHLDVRVFVLTPGTANALGEFVVNVKSNPGALGLFVDPVEAVASEAAKAIADKLAQNGR